MKTLLCALLIASFILGLGQSVRLSRLENLTHAIARTEGFGVKNSISTRCHNPGNLRSSKQGHHYAGQVGLNRSGYVIFADDAAGWQALRNQALLLKDFTFIQAAKAYTRGAGWQSWSNNVSNFLRVKPSTKIRDYLDQEY